MILVPATGNRDRRLWVPALWLSCLLSFHVAFGQEAESGAEQDAPSVDQISSQTEVDTEGEIEEITVFAPRSLVAIERQIERADIAMYESANRLIDDPLYKTYCELETSPGSRVKRRVCAAGYERELMSEAWEEERAMRRMGEDTFSSDYKLPEAELRQYRENLKQKMIELAAENPQLATAIYERAQLQRDYEAARKRRQQKED